MARESFIFYKSFYESIKELDKKTQAEIYNAIFSFQFDDVEVPLKGVPKSIFTLILPQLKANNTKYENGKKGGRPKNQTETKTKPKNNLNETQAKRNVNDNENVNVNVNENENENGNGNSKNCNTASPDFLEILNFGETLGASETYCRKFYNYYEERDWFSGKTKIKDWKQKFKEWYSEDEKEATPKHYYPLKEIEEGCFQL